MVKLGNDLYISVYGYGVQYGMNTKHTYSTQALCHVVQAVTFDSIFML